MRFPNLAGEMTNPILEIQTFIRTMMALMKPTQSATAKSEAHANYYYNELETALLLMIDDESIDSHLDAEFFLLCGYVGFERVLRKLREKGKMAQDDVVTALAYAVTSHSRTNYIVKNTANDNEQKHLLSHLYTNLEGDQLASQNVDDHLILDSFLRERRIRTRESLMPLYQDMLESKAIPTENFHNQTLAVITRNYDTELLTLANQSRFYQQQILMALLKGAQHNRDSISQLFLHLYLAAGLSCDFTFTLRATLPGSNSDEKTTALLQCNLLQYAVLLGQADLYFILAQHFPQSLFITPLVQATSENVEFDLEPIDLIDRKLTLLHLAAAKGLKDVISDLLNNKHAEINAKSETGLTPLMLATSNNHRSSIELLLDQKANPLLTTNDGSSACDFANNLEDVEIIGLSYRLWHQKKLEIMQKIQSAKESEKCPCCGNSLECDEKKSQSLETLEHEAKILLNRASTAYAKSLKKADIKEIEQFESHFLKKALSFFEHQKKFHKIDVISKQIKNVLKDLFPFIGFFGCDFRAAGKLLELCQYDTHFMILLTAYAVPNRSQQADTRVFEDLIMQSPFHRDEYKGHFHKHTRLNKVLWEKRNSLRQEGLPVLKELISEGFTEDLFGFTVTVTAKNYDTEFLQMLVKEMESCNIPNLKKHYAGFFERGPQMNVTSDAKSNQTDLQPVPEYARQFYLLNGGVSHSQILPDSSSADEEEAPQKPAPKKKKKKKKKSAKNASEAATTSNPSVATSISISSSSNTENAKPSTPASTSTESAKTAKPICSAFNEISKLNSTCSAFNELDILSIESDTKAASTAPSLTTESKSSSDAADTTEPNQRLKNVNSHPASTKAIFQMLKDPEESKRLNDEIHLSHGIILKSNELIDMMSNDNFDDVYKIKNIFALSVFNREELIKKQISRYEEQYTEWTKKPSQSISTRLFYMHQFITQLQAKQVEDKEILSFSRNA